MEKINIRDIFFQAFSCQRFIVYDNTTEFHGEC